MLLFAKEEYANISKSKSQVNGEFFVGSSAKYTTKICASKMLHQNILSDCNTVEPVYSEHKKTCI